MSNELRRISRNEEAIRRKLAAGWNAFSRDEVLGLFDALEMARLGKRRVQQRLNFAHFTPIAWHMDGDVGLHDRRPMPEGAVNLFEKPKAVDFPRGWRLHIPFRIPGYVINEDGTLTMTRSRASQRPMSPNDVMAQCMHTMDAIRAAYITQNKQEVEPAV